MAKSKNINELQSFIYVEADIYAVGAGDEESESV